MKIRGNHTTLVVTDDERPLNPEPSQELWNHSPDGFNWGYGGSGPAQLALALLLDAGLSNQDAVALHQRFKWDVIAKLPQTDFIIDANRVLAWIKQHHETADAEPESQAIPCGNCGEPTTRDSTYGNLCYRCIRAKNE